ncbi:MAG: ribosome maturation factor RimM [Christensenellales bacterium]|jgi:16S rRNA processing protein RimM
MNPQYFVIGEIAKPQGLRGEIKIRPHTSDPMRFEGMTQAYFKRDGAYVPVKLRVTRVTRDAAYLYIDGVSTREQIDQMRGELLYIDRANAIVLGEDENFITDLVGLMGVDDQGAEIGTLTDVLQPGGNDVYVFRGSRGEVLVPALKSVVLSVDLEAGRVTLAAARMAEVAVYEDED